MASMQNRIMMPSSGGSLNAGIAMTFDSKDLTVAVRKRRWEILYCYSTVVMENLGNDEGIPEPTTVTRLGELFCEMAGVSFLEFKNFRIYHDGSFKLIITADL